MENNQQNRGPQQQGQGKDQNNNNMNKEQVNNESLNTSSQQPTQNLRDKNVGRGRSYDYQEDYNSPEQDSERDRS